MGTVDRKNADSPSGLRMVVASLVGEPAEFGKNRTLSVMACNRNGLDLQSSRFSTGIDCVYPAPRTSIELQTNLHPATSTCNRAQPTRIKCD
ncbi:hypothetical protein ALP89_01146 [Pseudomonas syringae pv. persicae]|nr:hypothetical protein ALP89_01146 [Pseudomonas syringae pv. persicae]